MKSSPTVTDDCDDIFGPPRTYPTGYYPPKHRPSMISAKYRQKEERRKVLKISINKLKKIEDPEVSLCRSVLINNTMRRLQKEAKDEKLQKQLNYSRFYESDDSFANEKDEQRKSSTIETTKDFRSSECVVENDFHKRLEEEIDNVNTKNMDVLSVLEENLNKLEPEFSSNNSIVIEGNERNSRFSSRKRSFEDIEDCDVQDVLSQFYMPPTPRMLTCIDDDEDINVVDVEPVSKRIKTEVLSESSLENIQCVPSDCNCSDNSSVEISLNNNVTSSGNCSRYPNQNMEPDSSSFSCGQESMFSDLQNNVYHNLIASLET